MTYVSSCARQKQIRSRRITINLRIKKDKCVTIYNIDDTIKMSFILIVKQVSLALLHYMHFRYLSIGHIEPPPSIKIFLQDYQSTYEKHELNSSGNLVKKYISVMTFMFTKRPQSELMRYSMKLTSQKESLNTCLILPDDKHMEADIYGVEMMTFVITNTCGEFIYYSQNTYLYTFMPSFELSENVMVYHSLFINKCESKNIYDNITIEEKFKIHQTVGLIGSKYFFTINTISLILFFEKRTNCNASIQFRNNNFHFQIGEKTCRKNHVSVSKINTCTCHFFLSICLPLFATTRL